MLENADEQQDGVVAQTTLSQVESSQPPNTLEAKQEFVPASEGSSQT